MKLVKVENFKDLLRDSDTSAIINNNRTEYENYISNYNRLKEEKEEFQKLKSEVSSLSSSVDEIKSLLKLLVEDKKHGN